MEPISSKIKRRFKYYLSLPQSLAYKLFLSKKEVNIILSKLAKNKQPLPLNVEEDLKKQLSIISSFRVANETRKNILDATMNSTFKYLNGLGLDLVVEDASVPEYQEANKTFFEKFNLNLKYFASNLKLVNAYIKMLENLATPYFYMAFDDFVVLDLKPDFLKASTQLLKDYEGLVDCILIDPALKYNINDEKKTFEFDLKSLEVYLKPDNILGYANYGGNEFAIVKNFHYGFFFNTLIASKSAYLEKLKWYLENVSLSPHYIELAAAKKIGPVFKYLAIPLKVVQFDLDYEHTQISVRSQRADSKQIYNAINSNYSIIKS